MIESISKKTKNTYIYAAAGQGAIYAMVSSWALRYYTDVLGLELAFIMALMWVARMINAFADPVVGILVDRTNSRKGKMRPYLQYTPFIISLLTILLFVDIGIESQLIKCIYAGFIYIAWGIAYSFADSPLWGLPCDLTTNSEDRNKLYSLAKILNSIGGAIPTVVVSLLMSEQLLGVQKGIFFSAIGISVIGLIPFALVYPNTKEIHQGKTETISLKKQFKYTWENKILMLVVLSGILGFGRYLIQGAYTYCAEYVFECSSEFINSFKQVIGFALIGIGMFPTMILTPYLVKKYSYKWLMIGAGLLSTIIMIAFYFVGLATNYNFYIALIFLFLSGLPLGVFNIIITSVVGECVDYFEWKKGVRMEGMAASMTTFLAKVGSAIALGIIPLILMIVDYKADQVQSEGAKKGIFMLITIIPAISMFLCTIPMFFYDFVGEKREKALVELAQKREQEQIN